MRTKPLRMLLWLQLLFACAVTILSWGPMFTGASGAEATSHLQQELSSQQHSAGYQEPPRINSRSVSEIVSWLQDTTLDYMHLGGYCFLGGVGLIVLSGVELFLVYRLKRQVALETDAVETA